MEVHWKPVRIEGFWKRFLYGVFDSFGLGSIVGPYYQYVNDEGVLLRIHHDGAASLEPNSVVRSASFKRHAYAMDALVKRHGGVPFTLDTGPD